MIYAFPTFYVGFGETIGAYGRGLETVLDPDNRGFKVLDGVGAPGEIDGLGNEIQIFQSSAILLGTSPDRRTHTAAIMNIVTVREKQATKVIK